jgi:hypothetical protein
VWSSGGKWYSYMYILAIKAPVGTLLLFGLSIGAACCSGKYRGSLCDELCLLMPPFIILIVVSSQIGLTNAVRYTLPAIPFALVSIGRLGRAFQLGDRPVSAAVIISLAWVIVSSVLNYPHSMSYFNETVGGPKKGHYYLLDSNISCGQDLLLLRRWVDDHPEARPLQLAVVSWVNPRLAGIDFGLPPVGPNKRLGSNYHGDPEELGPQPGWYAIDVNFLHSTEWPAPTGDGKWQYIARDGPNFEYFLRFEPLARIGYSVYIYHITTEAADAARADLGLPPIARGDETPSLPIHRSLGD